jgi:hypothetical protein
MLILRGSERGSKKGYAGAGVVNSEKAELKEEKGCEN